MDKIVKIVEEGFQSEKIKALAKLEEGFESAKRNVLAKLKNHFKDEKQTSMKLQFRNGIARTIKTGEEIKGEGGVPIEIALVDDLGGDVVDIEPSIEIFLLKEFKPHDSDWTAEEFSSNIVPQVEGKRPILDGNVTFQLRGGVGAAKNIKIRHRASKIKPPRFMLGARAVGDPRIKEAKTGPFALKDFRTRYYEKHVNPSLSDEVSRLVYIRRGGKIDKRLQENKIYTVEDFLIQLLKNPAHLKKIVKTQAKKWKAAVENARACLTGERVYCYINPEGKGGVVFNILGHVLGTCSGSFYSHTSTLSPEQKAGAEKLVASACRKWEEVKAFDDQNSFQQHLSTRIDPDSRDSGSLSSFSDTVDGLYDAAKQCDPSVFEFLMLELDGDDEPQIGNRRNSTPKIWKKLLCVSKLLSVRKRVALDFSSCSNRKKQRVC